MTEVVGEALRQKQVIGIGYWNNQNKPFLTFLQDALNLYKDSSSPMLVCHKDYVEEAQTLVSHVVAAPVNKRLIILQEKEECSALIQLA